MDKVCESTFRLVYTLLFAGDSGKSTFFELLKDILCEFMGSVDRSAFVAPKSSGATHTEYLRPLLDTRMVHRSNDGKSLLCVCLI